MAGDQTEGIDEDRLARAGLAGEEVQTGAELDRQVLDDRDVTDAQGLQHGGRGGF